MLDANLDLLFEYITNREPGPRAKTVFLSFRRSMFFRAALLTLGLPFDILIIALQISRSPWQSESHAISLTRSAPHFCSKLTPSKLIYVGSPDWAIFCWQKKHQYMPASIPYILLTSALCFPINIRIKLAKIAIIIIRYLLRIYNANHANIIVHSDALPLARSFVLIAKERKVKSICIQHGIFHANSGIFNYDGYLCDFNIVRSTKDAELIGACNPNTKLIIEPDFFLPIVETPAQKNTKPVVTLIGEGWHSVDKDFSAKYLSLLRDIESTLLDNGYIVFFRPHPSERKMAKKFGFQKLDTENLSRSIATTDLYIGYSSTLLFEAASVGRCAGQIAIDDIFNPNMNREIVTIKKFESIDDILTTLKGYKTTLITEELDEKKNIAVKKVFAAIFSQD